MFEGKAIWDNTGFDAMSRPGEWVSLEKRVNDLAKQLRKDIEATADLVAGSYDSSTERGVQHITVFNGFFKEEGQFGEQVVLTTDLSADAQYAAYAELAEKTKQAVAYHREHTFGNASRLVWRRLPDFGRALEHDGLHLNLSVRFAWD